MRSKEKLIRRKKFIKKLHKEGSFCHIIGKTCDREKCDVYPCDGEFAFYNVPNRYLKMRVFKKE